MRHPHVYHYHNKYLADKLRQQQGLSITCWSNQLFTVYSHEHSKLLVQTTLLKYWHDFYDCIMANLKVIKLHSFFVLKCFHINL